MRIIREPQITSGFLYEQPLGPTSPVTHCGEAISVADHSLAWHSHPGFELQYLVRGRYPWRIGQRLYEQHMGQALIVPPRQGHGTHGVAPEECHHLWLGLHMDHLGDSGHRLARRLVDHEQHLLGECPEIEPVLRGIVAQVVTPRPGQQRVVRGYLDLLVRLLLQHLDTAEGKRIASQPYSYPVQKALYYMRTQLDRRLPVREIAAAAGWGVTQLCTRFHQEVGLTPVRYHLQLRLQAARIALQAPDVSVTRVAMEYGFSSSQHFATQFQRAFGSPPGRYLVRAVPVGST